jgi:uncharacterized cupredoxin-like copper-binding protein
MTKTLSSLAKYTFLATLGFTSNNLAFADDIVNVSLWDKGATADVVTNLAYAKNTDLSHANMGVKLDKQTVKAGKITFSMTNDSKDTIHEMLVIPLAGDASPIINENEARIAEDTANALGEVSETDPGKAGSLALELASGRYLVNCNIPGHYMNGMWAVLTVE